MPLGRLRKHHMKKAKLILLPQASQSSDVHVEKYVDCIYKRDIDLPEHAIQKGVILGFDGQDEEYNIHVAEIQYSVNDDSTFLVCTYSGKDLDKIGLFNKKSFFTSYIQRLENDGWVKHTKNVE